MLTTNESIWIRICANVGSGFGFTLIAATGATLVWKKDIGHRLLILFATLFFGERGITSFVTALEYFNEGATIVVALRVASAIVGIWFAMVLFASRDDILTTLQTTEEADQRRKDLARDAEQARINFTYLAETTLAISEETRAAQGGVLTRWRHRLG